MRRSITALALAVIMAVTMSAQNTYKPLTRDGYVDYLYKYMPLPDSLANPRSFWEEAVDKTLEVRDRMKWGVPEKEFRHFVLPLRVNNEDLDRFRALYADELCQRVKGMSLHDAALEINHWCHEWVTYVGTDARTRGPLATMRSGEGRCGEESTFTVSALRAAGIPARQVYTPLWAHTDSNHAWVEAWVDGKWYFLGACEPDPELNMGWFSGPVSRALLLHTKVSGDYKGDEDIIVKNPVYTEINVIKNYVPTRSTTVTVVSESGAPVPGVEVEYKIFNYGDFGNVCKITTDKAGQAKLATGKGDMLVWAAKGDRFGFAKLDREDVTIRLDKKKGDVFSLDLDMVPPAEDPLPNNATKEQIDANSKRLTQEDVIRKRNGVERDIIGQIGWNGCTFSVVTDTRLQIFFIDNDPVIPACRDDFVLQGNGLRQPLLCPLGRRIRRRVFFHRGVCEKQHACQSVLFHDGLGGGDLVKIAAGTQTPDQPAVPVPVGVPGLGTIHPDDHVMLIQRKNLPASRGFIFTGTGQPVLFIFRKGG